MIKYKLRKFKKLNKLRTRKVLLWISIILVFSLSLGSLARYYATNVGLDFKASVGISEDGTTVVINDLETDWNYYESLNYTEINDRSTLPTYQDKYNNKTLVAVQINYNSTDINDSNKIGYVSNKTNEGQSKYTYYKYYPIEKDNTGKEYIKIELIDNPWSSRPTGYGFNNWVCDTTSINMNIDCNSIEFSYDNQYYTRYVKIPANSNIEDEKIILDLKTSWIKADIKSNIDELSNYNTKGLKPVSNNNDIKEDITKDGYNLTGYYYKVNSVTNNGLYYDINGNLCDSNNPCTEGYKLIQNNDTTYNTGSSSLNVSNYYYMVTRDTNIFEVNNNGIGLSTFSIDSPLTITSSHDGSKSTNNEIVSESITSKSDMVLENVVMSGGNTSVNALDSAAAHHIKESDSSSYKSFFANANLKIGRNFISSASNAYSLDDVVGGINVKTIIESGFYHDLVVLPSSSDIGHTNNTHNYAIYGSDYDRAISENNNLIIQFQALSSVSYRHDNSDGPVSEMLVKSGTYGNAALSSTNSNMFYLFGIYAGSSRTNSDAYTSSLKLLKIEGGKIVNVNGGPFIKEGLRDVSIGIYMTGGEVENMVGGAGTAKAYGSRVVSVSGGQINNALAGGSNSYYDESNSGPLTSDTLVYVGGNIQIGATTMLSNNNALYAIEKRGSIFGAGLGNPTYEDRGGVDNSKVIINGGAIEGDVYGGGNFGGTGLTLLNALTEIEIKDGTIKGSVFGGSNKNGFGNTNSQQGNVRITVDGGTIGNIYGGSNERGTVTGDLNINLNGGHITGAVYAGGYGAETYLNGQINVNTTNSNNLVIDKDINGGSIYGGSANGIVNKTSVDTEGGVDLATTQLYYIGAVIPSGSTYSKATGITAGYIVDSHSSGSSRFKTYSNSYRNTKCNVNSGCEVYFIAPMEETSLGIMMDGVDYYYFTGSSMEIAEVVTATDRGNVNVNINGGTINGGVFGGGYGDLNAPQTYGTITVEVNDGDINEVYAGNNVRGTIDKPQEEFKVTIKGGKVHNVFGGSKGEQAGAKITNVIITGGEITGGVYGGGYAAKTETSHVLVEGGKFYNETPDGSEPTEGGSVYGGGYAASVTDAKVDIKGTAKVFNAFGGSNVSGLVNNAIVNYDAGTVINAYGGGNIASVKNTQVNLNGTTITNAYAGGAKADIEEKSTMILNNGTITNLFGGSNMAGTVKYSDVQLRNGTITNVFGGNNAGGITGDGLLDIEPSEDGTLTITNVYGGSKGAEATSKYTNVKIKGRIVDETNQLSIENIYGGGYEAKTGGYTENETSKETILGYTRLYIQDVTVNDIFAGGFRGPVIGDTYANIIKNVKANNIYGGGFYAYVGHADSNDATGEYVAGSGITDGHTFVNIISADISGNVYGSGNASFVYGETNVNIGDNAINNIENQINRSGSFEYEQEFIDVISEEKLNPVIHVLGNVFGGSETNASETTIFDDRFKGVIGTSRVNISGENYVKLTRDASDDINLKISKSIYGGGNNSGVDGTSKVLVNKLGTKSTPAEMTSIQRATNAYLVDSYIKLTGMKDRAFTTGSNYSLIRIDNLYLLGNKDNEEITGSTLYLQKSTTFLSNHYSGTAIIDIANTGIKDDTFEIEKVSKSEDGEHTNITPLNADNEVYVLKDRPTVSYAVVTGEVPSIENDLSNAGSVHGMTYFGLYYDRQAGNRNIIETDYYNRNAGNSTGNYDSSSLNNAYSYVFGKHDSDVQTQMVNNGFYTNIYSATTAYVDVDYIKPSPANTAYYRWEIGNNVVTIDVNIEANKYSQRTAVNANISLEEIMEQLEDGSMGYWNDSKLTIKSVSTSTLRSTDAGTSASLINRTDIPVVNTNDDNNDGVVDANNKFALAMGTTTTGWLDNYRTEFFSSDSDTGDMNNFCNGTDGKCVGSNEYYFDSSHDLRTLSFWLYYSQNLDLSKATKIDDDDIPTLNMGFVEINTEILRMNDDFTASADIIPVVITVYVSLTDGDTDSYGALMSPGKKYEIFQDRNVSIAANGSFSLYQKLSLDLNQNVAGTDNKWDVNDLYNGEIIEKQVRVNGIDTTQYWGPSYRYLETDYDFPIGSRITMIDLANNEQYFYEVSDTNQAIKEEDALSVRYKYYLKDFAKMGCTKLYDENGNRIDENFFDEDMTGRKSKFYHNSDANFAIEEFVFIVDFGGAEFGEETFAEYAERASSETHYFYMKMARQIASSLDENGELLNSSESSVVIPRGQPTNDLVFTLNPTISSIITTTGSFYDELSGTLKETTKVYDDTDNLTLRLETKLNQFIESSGAIGIVDTQYEDYRVGAKILIQRQVKDSNNNVVLDENGNPRYEDVTEELKGLSVTSRGRTYYPYTDGSIRLQLAGRITEIGSPIKIDFSNSELNYGKYRLSVQTFVTFDGLYSAIDNPNNLYLDFELLDSDYGLSISTDPVSITHDVATGLDANGSNEIKYTIKTKNGLTSPNLKINLQRRVYEEDAYSTEYETINISDLFTEIKLIDSNDIVKNEDVFNSCLEEMVPEEVDSEELDENGDPKKVTIYVPKCKNTYSLGPIEQSKRVSDTGEATDEMKEYTLIVKLKEGPTEEEKANQIDSLWKSGTYRIVISMYDDATNEAGDFMTTKMGETYEYLIIRSLDVDGEEGSES